MFAIGEFARHGRVSVRMLRHYDATGLLEPVSVDPGSGYRFYEAAQLSRLNRIIALKDLGLTLQQVASILDDQVSAAELRGMLTLRRAELQAQITSDTARLARVEARLLTIESEASATAPSVVIKRIAPLLVAELTGIAASYEPEAITPVIQPLCHELPHQLCTAGAAIAGPPVAYYADAAGDTGGIEVHAALPSIQALARWIDANGYSSLGYARELTLEFGGERGQWVTELQEPITTAQGEPWASQQRSPSEPRSRMSPSERR